MSTEEFQIEFHYQEIPYIGLVEPIRKGTSIWYRVNLESENQEELVEILAKPAELEEWQFECEPSGNALDYYDKGLLEEIGEAIERYNISDLKTGGEE